MTDADTVRDALGVCRYSTLPCREKSYIDPDEWCPECNAHAALDRLVAERDALLPPYSEATQLFIDAICHYRNLAISLGARPNDMLNDYDHRLAESGVKDGDGDGWWNEAPSLWDDLEAAEAERDRLRSALEQIQAWDCLNPPDPNLCADHPWLKRLVDEALGKG